MHRYVRPARGAGTVLLAAVSLVFATAAHAIVQGYPSSLDRHVVRMGGSVVCSGVVIGRSTVVTAAHCPSGSVVAGGAIVGVASRTRGTVTLDDGTRVTVSGDSVVLRLRSPLPASVSPVRVAEGVHDGQFIIAGYGTPTETNRSYGQLREAVLIDSKVERNMLVDPNRSGPISASACFGDSGGAVLQRAGGGYHLVGVISRANYPNRAIACGFYTRYAPVRASGGSAVAATRPDGFALSTLTSTDIASPSPPRAAVTQRTASQPAKGKARAASKAKGEPAGFFSERMQVWRARFRVADN